MNKKDLKVIRRIQAEAWGKFGDKLFKEEYEMPKTREMIDDALGKDSKKFDSKTLKNIEKKIDTGVFDRKKRVEDEAVSKKYTKYVEEKIKSAVESGELTHPDKDPYVKKGKQLANRAKQD